MKPLARWTIGNTTSDGFESLVLSIQSFTKLYDVDIIICHNCSKEKLPSECFQYDLFDQNKKWDDMPDPCGVAWKLYPTRFDPTRHEIQIDNDIIFTDSVSQINDFFNSDSTLLLEDVNRTYGRFEKHVPPKFQINSGIFGLPPKFDLNKFIKFYVGDRWEQNALNSNAKSFTFDEQGLVALALLSYKKYIIIPNTVITDCGTTLRIAKAMHFMGLNRTGFHRPYRLFRSYSRKMNM